ncbi:hypothetical protein [Paenibacillus sp. PAMC21692]|uniref:hypothetical protein n=1 Tax=Paenibacillus sp. PAMC21692 TaxID=2762320 RepID=UPI00164D28C9|nr:hypothetical protein [Paenibacillus sp. PAMC21692]QNK57420.1 hypothetical protein H7F31_33980 [Paenibacillus sp. PAMC21692]
MRPLPGVKNLEQACRKVVESNTADKHYPGYFDSMTRGKDSEALLPVISRLILEATFLEKVERIMKKCRSMLTIEDLVDYYGNTWGFDDRVIEAARQRVEYFDRIVVGKVRYGKPDLE